MIDVDAYLCKVTGLLQHTFGTRLIYVGLQGSYLRGEAHENSDIDVMVVLDGLTVEDMDRYREIIMSAGHKEKSCGFLCAREDLLHWNPCEICHLLHTTRDFYGQLQPLVPVYTDEDVRTFVKLSVGNLYHALCHTYVHAGGAAAARALPGLYKQVFFILQNRYFLQTGRFVVRKAELLPALEGLDQQVMARTIDLQSLGQGALQLLFAWCQETLQTL